MKDKIKSALIKAKNHVSENKFAYAMGVLSAALIHGNLRTSKHLDAFLTEKGIDPMEFWAPEDLEEEKVS